MHNLLMLLWQIASAMLMRGRNLREKQRQKTYPFVKLVVVQIPRQSFITSFSSLCLKVVGQPLSTAIFYAHVDILVSRWLRSLDCGAVNRHILQHTENRLFIHK